MRIFCKLILSIIILTTSLLGCNTVLAAKLDPATGSLFMKADKVEYLEQQGIIIATGNIFIQFENYLLKSDYIYYDINKDHLIAEGNIRVSDDEDRIIIGKKAIFSDKLKKGIIEKFIMKIGDSYVMANAAKRIDENKSQLHKAIFTPCTIYCSREPIWKVSAEDAFLDFETNKMVYSNVFFQVYGVPIAYLPYFEHPTPQAPAKTGLLRPEIKQGSLIIPFYYRVRDNFDFTISPRLATNYTIFEVEGRHKIKHGDYKLTGSFGNTPQLIEKEDGIVKNSKTHRYHIFAEGNFRYQDYHYGFDIRRTSSDKSYLKNYHQIFDSYLPSKVYLNKIDQKNYFAISGLYFQGLRTEDRKDQMPFIFPNIDYKNVIPISDDETTTLTVNNNMMLYNESYIRQIGRNALAVAATKNIYTDSGQIVNLGISNRTDYYFANIRDSNKINNEKIMFRHIPEIFTTWRYPLVSSISSRTSIKIEPIVSAILGRSYQERFNKFGLIDSPKFDLSEETLFNYNRTTGIDFHEYGKRLNYGVNVSIYSDILYLNSFLGQGLYQDNVIDSNNREYVGSISLDILNQIAITHKFRKDTDLSPIRDEISLGYTKENFNFATHYITLHKISKYFANDNYIVNNNQLKNVTFNASYKITDILSIAGASTYDLSATGKFNQLTRTISVTYFKDCVSISAKISDDFTQDKGRGVKKIKSQSFAVGLKVINM